MNMVEIKNLIEKAEKSKNLIKKIDWLQNKINELNQQKLKATVSFKSLCPAPSEYSNDKIWTEIEMDFIDERKFINLVNDELRHQLEEQLKLAFVELEQFN